MHDNDLPVHSFTGLPALAVLDSGRIVWPVMGGADDEAEAEGKDAEDGTDADGGAGEDADQDQDDDEQDDADEDDKPLGPKGERALAAMKEKLKAERAKRRAAEAKLNGEDADDKPDPGAAATARANARILRSEIKAAAAGKFADPKDALRFLDLDSFEVDTDGEVDEDEIAEAIDDLLKKKPYLAAQSGKPRFQGTGDGGSRKGNGRPSQLSREDLKRMSPEAIVKAKAEGRLNEALGINR
jgi:hypothetical protein